MRRLCVVLCFALAIAVSGAAWAADSVMIHLKWLHSAQFAGLYAAEANGLFARSDLDVELIDGLVGEPELRALAEGAYDFVLADPSRHMDLVSQGVANVAVAAVFQIDPVVIFSLAESGIRRPEDLIGERIMGFPTSCVISAVLARVGLGPEDVEIGPSSFDLSELYSGAYDAWSGYYTNEVLLARAEGYDVNVIYPTDYGVHLYGDVLVTRRELVETNPDLVRRVVRALIEGWDWVLGHVKEAAALVLRWNPALDVEHQVLALEASLPFIHAGEHGLGGMTDERWRSMAEMMKAFGLLPEDFDPQLAYVLEFTSLGGAQAP